MEYVLDNVEGAYEEAPSPEHFEAIMDGVIDTVAITGAEGFSGSYTRAQKYLWSCMDSSDTISWQQRRDGMEGLISDGLSSAWEFIKKIFSSIWKFFFGDGEESATKEADKTIKDVKENEEALKKVVKPSTDEEKKESVKKAKSAAQKIQKDPKSSASAKSKAKSVEDQIDAAMKSDGPLKLDGSSYITDLLKTDLDRRLIPFNTAVKAAEEKAVAANVSFEKDRSSEFKTNPALKKQYVDGRAMMKTIFGGFASNNQWTIAKKITNLADAQASQAALVKILEGMKKATEHFRTGKNEMNKLINDLQKDMNSDKAKKNDAGLQGTLAEMKVLGALLTNSHSQLRAVFGITRRISDEVNRLVGV